MSNPNINVNVSGPIQPECVYKTKVLRGNQLFADQIEDANTKYVIKHNFDLQGGTVNISAGCILEFDGGSLSNGTIKGSNTTINAGNAKIFDGIVFSGTFASNMNALWLGIKGNNSNNSQILSDYLNSNRMVYKGFYEIDFPNGTYYFNEPIAVTSSTWLPLIIEGNGSFFLITYNTTDTFLKFEGKDELQIRNIYFQGGTTWDNKMVPTKPTCIELNRCQYFSLENVKIYNLLCGVLLKDCWYGTFDGNCTFQNVMVGVKTDVVSATFEINNIDFAGLTVHGCNRDYIKSIFPQEAGESNDDYALRVATCGLDFHTGTHNVQFRGVCVEGLDYGFRFNALEANATSILDNIINIDNCYFEGNFVRDIFIGEGYVYKTTSSSYRKWQGGDVAVNSCTFHNTTIDYHIYILGCNTRLTGGEYKIRAKVDGTRNSLPARVEYDNNVSVDIVGNYCRGRDISVKNAVLNNGYPKILENIPDEHGKVMLMSVGAANCRYNANISWGNDVTAYRKIPTEGALTIEKQMSFQTLYKFVSAIYDKDSNTVKAGVVSAGKIIWVNTTMWGSGFKIDPATAIFTKSIRRDAITFEEFLTKWDANQNYTGYVETIFPLQIRTDVINGLVYMTVNGSEVIVAYGKNAFSATGTNSYELGVAINLDTMCITNGKVSTGIMNICDMVQCCRNYNEVCPNNIDRKRFYVTTDSEFGNVIKCLNTIIFDARDISPSNHKYKIFNGYDFVELTNRTQRYEYVDSGKSIAQRMFRADLDGQTYFNRATGITYTFYVSDNKVNGYWVTSIGNVDSLDHPNGYNATSNPITWATELQTGEMVACQGKIYKWDGSNFVDIIATTV